MAKDKFDPERDIVHDSIQVIGATESGGVSYINVAGSFDATLYLLNGEKILQCVVVELPRRGDEVRINNTPYRVVLIEREYMEGSIHKATIHVE